MPELESPKNQKTAAETTDAKPLCHIHDEVIDWKVDIIHKNVCVNDEPLTKHTDGKHYCLFHLPTEDKDIAKFEGKFRERLKEVEEKLAAIEELPEAERESQKERISYNFSYVWFPSEIYFDNYKFLAITNFYSAIFTSGANFYSAIFTSVANFSSVTFTYDADFRSATFTGGADFESATFTSKADFSSATFTSFADFESATFNSVANFTKTELGKDGQMSFKETNFVKEVYFDETEFNGDVSFESAIFGSDSYVVFLKAFFAKNADFRYCTAEGYLQFSYCRNGAECAFDFQEAAFEKASRVSFHTVRLRPNWFVNIDSRKFVFTDIDWCNLVYERGNKNIERELGALEKREITTQRKRLLEIAARQLAVNAEDNNRYEEAAKFRYLAMETKRLEEGKFFSKLIVTLYKWTSGYGESWSWAALVLLVLLFGFGIFYNSPLANFEPLEKKTAAVSADNVPPPPDYHKMNNAEGFVHSLYVAALQRPEPKAADTTTRLFIILETIFAPLQAALLALAIRRKFMR